MGKYKFGHVVKELKGKHLRSASVGRIKRGGHVALVLSDPLVVDQSKFLIYKAQFEDMIYSTTIYTQVHNRLENWGKLEGKREKK